MTFSSSNPYDQNSNPVYRVLQSALLFSLIILLALSLTRLGILVFIIDGQNFHLAEISDLFITGLRIDLKVIGSVLFLFLCLPAFIMALLNRWYLFLHWLRLSLLLVIIYILLLSFIDIGYYLYFGNSIDVLVFGIIEDGTSEVLSSIFGDWRLLVIIVSCIVSLVFVSYWFMHKTRLTSKQTYSDFSKSKNIVLILVASVLTMAMARGSFDTFPLSRKTVSVSDNRLLNSLVFNAPLHLYYTFKDRQIDSFNELKSDNILSESGMQTLQQLIAAAGYTDENPLEKISSTKAADFKPPHVIFVLMESWSSHIALQDSEQNNLLGAFSQHAKNDYFYPHFFSNGYGTNPTIDSLLVNSPITPLSQSAAARHAFGLSNIIPFKQHGYNTLFLSGGSSSWRNHDNFWPLQGFDQYIGRATIEQHYNVKADNPWGVYETYLFEYMKKTLLEAEQSAAPLFSFVLTTNNHPPIRLPADYKAPPFSMQPFGLAEDDSAKRDILSGFHYESNALGQFLSWLKQSPLKDKVIVVATGDHIYKGFVNYTGKDMAYLRYSVPAYFYLPPRYDELKSVDPDVVGSHEDIFPTLFELSLSAEKYFAFGTPLMDKRNESAFGWIDQGSYLFNDGVVMSDQLMYPWKDAEKITLNVQGQQADNLQRRLIEQQQYKMMLKRYLLVKDFEQAARH